MSSDDVTDTLVTVLGKGSSFGVSSVMCCTAAVVLPIPRNVIAFFASKLTLFPHSFPAVQHAVLYSGLAVACISHSY